MDPAIHDIKTERQSTSAGLAPAFKLVPIGFYLVIASSLLLSGFFFLSKKAYEAVDEEARMRLENATSEKNRFTQQQTTVVAEAKRAEGLARWLEGSRPLQPVTVAVGRSMSKDSTIAELSLDRNPEIPAHTFMQLKVDGGGSEQIENTLSQINSLSYQTYSAQQVKGRNSIDFQATLIYSEK